MAGFEVNTNEHLIRSNLWSNTLKTLLEDELYAMRYVRILTDFPDGTTFNIPTLGEAETFDFAEGQRVKYNKMDTGNYTFSFTQYKGSAHSISEKFKRDSFYAQDVLSAFLPRQHRALMKAVETRILAVGNAGQTASSLNTINGGDHRFVAGGTSEVIAIKDFARAQYALSRANVPLTNLVAIVDPSVIYALQTQTNLVNLLSPMPQWDQVVKTGAVSGMKFQMNVMGFDIYSSNYLPRDISETVDSVSVTTGVANYFFAAAGGDVNPFIGGFRQNPTVYSEFNKDTQETEYLTIAEYDFALYREENLVTVLTDTDQVS
jgi:hypothetical protein